MNITLQVERIKPNTSNGFGIKIIQTYTSFNEEDINLIEETYKQYNITVLFMKWLIRIIQVL